MESERLKKDTPTGSESIYLKVDLPNHFPFPSFSPSLLNLSGVEVTLSAFTHSSETAGTLRFRQPIKPVSYSQKYVFLTQLRPAHKPQYSRNKSPTHTGDNSADLCQTIPITSLNSPHLNHTSVSNVSQYTHSGVRRV